MMIWVNDPQNNSYWDLFKDGTASKNIENAIATIFLGGIVTVTISMIGETDKISSTSMSLKEIMSNVESRCLSFIELKAKDKKEGWIE